VVIDVEVDEEELPAVVIVDNDPSSASVKGMNMNTKGRKEVSKKGCNVSVNGGQCVTPDNKARLGYSKVTLSSRDVIQTASTVLSMVLQCICRYDLERL
jgi:hypothetical protein